MKLPLWTVFVFCGVLLLFVQLVAAFMPVTVAVLASVAIGFLVFLLPDFFLAKVEAWWPPVALAALALHVALDGMDGPLARWTHTASRRGSLADVPRPMRPTRSVESGSPAPNFAHVAPPSVDR